MSLPRVPIRVSASLICMLTLVSLDHTHAAEIEVTEDNDSIRIQTDALKGAIRKHSYVSGVGGGSLVDMKTGFHDPTFGMDIMDWLMEPGTDREYRDKIPKELVYDFGNAYHGNIQKRSIEGPQICTQAGKLTPSVIKGKDFVGIQQGYTYHTSAPDKKTGSRWEQTIVFPKGTRYFISADLIHSVNDSDELFFRQDLPGHIGHQKGNTFSEVYLSYLEDPKFPDKKIPSSEFNDNFAPDEKFRYSRKDGKVPQRAIRAYHLRDPKTGKAGPWLAGMTLNPADLYEGWCHQRGYVCFIQEIGGRPIKAGESFGAAFIVGYFDSIDEMNKVYDQYAGNSRLVVTENDWKLTPAEGSAKKQPAK
ncbi:MAG: hypothetical protein SGJ20_16120 [Planctomycetota bacterium]|nr:hypothetical protein [Planctomycetota bacterium]